MKLTDLHPKWLGAGGDGIFKADGSPAPERTGVALMFDCPCGATDSFVCIHVNPPLDGGEPLESSGHMWIREGDKFETLTLTPSILRHDCCKWHGYVTNGEIRTC